MLKGVNGIYGLFHLNICQIYRGISIHVRNPNRQFIISRNKGFCQHLTKTCAGIHHLFQCFILMVSNASNYIFIKRQGYCNWITLYKFFIICAKTGCKLLINSRKFCNLFRLLLHFHTQQLHFAVSIQVSNSNGQAVITRSNCSSKRFSGSKTLHSGPFRSIVIHICLYSLIKGQRYFCWFSRLIFTVIFAKAGCKSIPLTSEHGNRATRFIKNTRIPINNGKP